MKNFCVVSLLGEVKRFGVCQDDMLDAQIVDNDEIVIDTVVYKSLINHYYNGELFIEMPSKPSDAHIFNYSIKQWEFDESIVINAAIRQRNVMLSLSDWTQLPDVPLATKEAWATYRQALRDITAQQGYPLNIIWPDRPQ